MDGTIARDVKFKSVEEDFNLGKCTLIDWKLRLTIP
jgi:hypothetical protein